MHTSLLKITKDHILLTWVGCLSKLLSYQLAPWFRFQKIKVHATRQTLKYYLGERFLSPSICPCKQMSALHQVSFKLVQWFHRNRFLIISLLTPLKGKKIMQWYFLNNWSIDSAEEELNCKRDIWHLRIAFTTMTRYYR